MFNTLCATFHFLPGPHGADTANLPVSEVRTLGLRDGKYLAKSTLLGKCWSSTGTQILKQSFLLLEKDTRE